MEIRKQPALPIILVKEDGKKYKVDWDYQTAQESAVLSTNAQYLEGYLYGVITALNIRHKDLNDSISPLSGKTGTITGLDECTANKLAAILKNVLHPMVTKEHKRLWVEANLPHIKFMREREQTKASNEPSSQ